MCENRDMVIARSKITSQSQISVPYAIRKKLGIGPGSVLEWMDDGENIVVKRAIRYSSEDIHDAVFAAKPKPKTLDELKAGVTKAIKEKHAKR
jgi:AbrB family looped-hinge helix DNA binding protein